MPRVQIFPATHYVAGDERMRTAVVGIEAELQERLAWFEANGKLLEAQRLRMRTQYDLEMIQEVGYCNGIENYSMHIDGRSSGQPPFTLLDYFPKDFLLVIDESHQAIPQLHGQYLGDLQPQGHPGRARLPPAERARQPPAALRGGARADQPVHLPVGHAGRRGRSSTPPRSSSRSSGPPG